ncbi:MAG: hypothetical protein OWQ50_03115 [Acidianus infernus]|nr:hypothetical protein [Acidianus infernus]
MAQNQAQNNSPQQGEGNYKINVVFSFVQTLDEKDHTVWDLIISTPNIMDPIKVRIPNDVHYELEEEAKKLVKLDKIIPIIERDVRIDPVVKEMYITVGKIIWTLLEY